MKAIWTGPARRDLDEIWTFIAEDNIDAADAHIQKLRAAALILEESPMAGRIGTLSRSRELIVAGTAYRLIYRVTRDTIAILRVIHGARDWPPRRRRP